MCVMGERDVKCVSVWGSSVLVRVSECIIVRFVFGL